MKNFNTYEFKDGTFLETEGKIHLAFQPAEKRNELKGKKIQKLIIPQKSGRSFEFQVTKMKFTKDDFNDEVTFEIVRKQNKNMKKDKKNKFKIGDWSAGTVRPPRL